MIRRCHGTVPLAALVTAFRQHATWCCAERRAVDRPCTDRTARPGNAVRRGDVRWSHAWNGRRCECRRPVRRADGGEHKGRPVCSQGGVNEQRSRHERSRCRRQRCRSHLNVSVMLLSDLKGVAASRLPSDHRFGRASHLCTAALEPFGIARAYCNTDPWGIGMFSIDWRGALPRGDHCRY